MAGSPGEGERKMSETQGLDTNIAETRADNETWHEHRKTGIGGSDAGAVLGIDPWQSEFELYSRKVGLIGEKHAGEAAMWGLLHEPTIRRWYEGETGRATHSMFWQFKFPNARGEVAGNRVVLRSTSNPFMLANLDAVIEDEEKGIGVLEIKTSAWPEAWEEGPPPWCYAQMQHYLAVTGLQWGAFAVLFKGNMGGHMDVERDDAYIADLIEKEVEFWRRVQENDSPEADGSKSSERALRQIYSASTGETIDLPAKADEYIEAIELAKMDAKRAESEKRIAETCLRALMGSAKAGNTPGGGRVLRVDVRATHIEAHTREPYSFFRTVSG